MFPDIEHVYYISCRHFALIQELIARILPKIQHIIPNRCCFQLTHIKMEMPCSMYQVQIVLFSEILHLLKIGGIPFIIYSLSASFMLQNVFAYSVTTFLCVATSLQSFKVLRLVFKC